MDNNQLRMLAGAIVTESELSSSAKLQLLNFIQSEATVPQVKALLMDGEIVTLDEQAEEIVNIRFENHPVNEGTYKTLFGVVLFGLGGWTLYRSIRALADKKSKQCGAYRVGRVRDVCLWKVRAEEAKKLSSIISKQKTHCSNSKNPSECKATIDKRVAKYNERYQKNISKIKNYAGKSAKKGAKAVRGTAMAADKSGKWI